MSDPFSPLNGAGRSSRPKAEEWTPRLPVPDDAPPSPAEHFKRGKPSAIWTYRDATGRLLGYVWRFDAGDGQKEFYPLTFCRNKASGKSEWRMKSWDEPRPLYNLDCLAKRPDVPIIVCEGEKAADAAARLLPNMVAITSPGGAKAARKANWNVLKGHDVAVWRDNDAAGLHYAQDVAELAVKAGALSVSIVQPDPSLPNGFDAADAETANWDDNKVHELLQTAKLFQIGGTASATKEGKGRDRRPRQTDGIVELVENSGAELWMDQDGEAYASIVINTHMENWALRSREFRRWVSGAHYLASGGAIGSQALEDTLRVLEAKAEMEGKRYETFRRVGAVGENIYIDRCDAEWRAIEVGPLGWASIDRAPCKFIRGAAMRPLPEPEAGSSIDELRQFINVSTDADFHLIVAWLIAALRAKGPFPILAISGEQGSGKSVVSQLLRQLCDPNGAPLRSPPEKDRDLYNMADNNWVMALDNLSSMAEWLSDAMCRIATGGGFSARTLHSDRAETFFHFARPVLLNGIPTLTNRPDLADRAVMINLRSIPETERRAESEFWRDFEAAKPRILGALLDGVSSGLRNLHKIHLVRSPRMADFAQWVTAAEAGLGWDAETFITAYFDNRKEMVESSFEADPLAVAIDKFIRGRPGQSYDGTMSELLPLLNDSVPEAVRKNRRWPDTATRLGSSMRRIYPTLRARGFTIEFRHSTVRWVTITAPRDASL